jgi:hypothetical protein
MTDAMIPDDIRAFLLENIDSIAQLEGLLLLRGNPDKKWSAEDVARRLYINQSDAEVFLTRLAVRQLLSASGSQPCLYQYQSDAKIEDIVRCTADIYSRFLLPVTNLIHSQEKSRIQGFADAFRIRKDTP